MLCHPEHPHENVDLTAVVAHKTFLEFFGKLHNTECMINDRIVKAYAKENIFPTSHNQCHNKCLHIDKQSEMQEEIIIYFSLIPIHGIPHI